ncbi:MAG: hypothetical protein [Cryophage ML09]|nr:MAG: hypothetical protein [Cryophage ML09]
MRITKNLQLVYTTDDELERAEEIAKEEARKQKDIYVYNFSRDETRTKIESLLTLIMDDYISINQAVSLIDELFLIERAMDRCKSLVYRLTNPIPPSDILRPTIKSEDVKKYFLRTYSKLYKKELEIKINCVLYGDSQSKES